MNVERSFTVVGGFTLLSRVFGFVRDLFLASSLGTGLVSDAFFLSFRFPNLFRRLFAEGAFSSGFVPLFAKRLEGEGRREALRFAEEALSLLLGILLVTTVLAELLMPWILYLFSPGFVDSELQYGLAVSYGRIMFPYLLLMSGTALLSGILNALHRFAMAAFAPVILNVFLVMTMIYFLVIGEEDHPGLGMALSIAVTASGFAQFGLLWWTARGVGMAPNLIFPRWTPDMARLLRLCGPGMISGGVTQVNLLVGTAIASLQAGAVTYLYYAERVYQLPLGVVGIAIGTVLLPNLSRHLRAERWDEAYDSQRRSVNVSLLLTIPAAVVSLVFSEQILSVLFERGAFTKEAVQASAAALRAFALGLPSFVLIKVLLPGFFAREDTRTPMWCAAVNMVINTVGSGLLYIPFGYVGIAVATSVSGWIHVGMLWRILSLRGNLGIVASRTVPVWAFCSVVMWAVTYGLSWMSGEVFEHAGSVCSFVLLGLISAFSLIFFSFIAWLFGICEVSYLWKVLSRRG